MSKHNINIKKENHPTLVQIKECLQLWNFFIGTQEEFEIAMVNEPSVFEPLKFYCIGQSLFQECQL